jgi:Ca2+-binding EF-hand superfamily protein
MRNLTLLAALLALPPAARAADAPAAPAPVNDADIHVKDTPKERKRVHAHFAAIDKNGDGVIDDAELAAYAKKVHAAAEKAAKKSKAKEPAPSEERILADLKKELSKADAKHDGKITEAEYDQYEEPLENR